MSFLRETAEGRRNVVKFFDNSPSKQALYKTIQMCTFSVKIEGNVLNNVSKISENYYYKVTSLI